MKKAIGWILILLTVGPVGLIGKELLMTEFNPIFLIPVGIFLIPFALGIWLVNGSKQKKGIIGRVSKEDEFHRNQEILSCPTCMFFNKQATGEEQKWCNAPEGHPDIVKNYCNTFKSNKLGGNG